MTTSAYVYSEAFCNLPMGYVEYYERKYPAVAEYYYLKYPHIAEDLRKSIAKQKFHFARKVAKQHPRLIPRYVIDMKIKRFVKEVVDKVLAHNQPKQLELDFKEETNDNKGV